MPQKLRTYSCRVPGAENPRRGRGDLKKCQKANGENQTPLWQEFPPIPLPSGADDVYVESREPLAARNWDWQGRDLGQTKSVKCASTQKISRRACRSLVHSCRRTESRPYTFQRMPTDHRDRNHCGTSPARTGARSMEMFSLLTQNIAE